MSLHLPPFPLAFTLRLHSDGCRLVGMLTLDARLKKIAMRTQLNVDTASKPLYASIDRDTEYITTQCVHLLFAQLLTSFMTFVRAQEGQHLELIGA